MTAAAESAVDKDVPVATLDDDAVRLIASPRFADARRTSTARPSVSTVHRQAATP